MPEDRLFAEKALLPGGWAQDVLFTFDAAGNIASVVPDVAPEGAPRAAGPVIPGMPNLHSHAFQRAMAGLAERAGPGEESFWTWREVMYGFLARIGPADLEAIAAQLYLEMLKAGYTAVGEFHYLHHGPDGRPYADPAEMSRRVVSAAATTGIGITQLPVLYGYSGFGGQAAGAGQRRFLHDGESYNGLLARLFGLYGEDPQVGLGIAPHSLRATTAESLTAGLAALDALDPGAPVHIHIAEQEKEIADCIAWSGRRPVEWLFEHFQVGPRWCLVHATHMTAAETAALAASGAVAGLCPTTEANLGDGLFPAIDYLGARGAWGIGSDSQISVSPVEELRWLEYGQRLFHRRRALLADGPGGSVGANLWRQAVAGGARALGRPIGRLKAAARADLLVLDPEAPALIAQQGDGVIDALVFNGNASLVRDVMVGGRWRVQEGHHDAEEAVAGGFRAVLRRLLAD